ncbi:tripartite motif-containing protein 3-like isoform X2 [Mizuhopecten yessoensis]|uniref:Tripartite motif-containing protein 2 n=1 Tax=Mizuhopecten yessoensis TaxID=6573 RepID=A0A210PGV0_MIZYE|nr:tripartite motif-containing protein 3-like isoform X2 [Mizuhopecten yessoensis]OWF35714.1 Tripartite motif-containing protein 2 [Mizuhopecten yessoensis]
MFRSRSIPESTIPIPNVTSLTESNPGHEGSLKRRFSSTLDRIFKNKLSTHSHSPDFSIEMEHVDIEDDIEEEICTDDSGESDSEALTSWNGMEGHTNLQFVFDNECHLDNLQPEVVMTFPSNKKVGCLSDASDVIYIGDGRSLVVDMIGNRVLHFNKRGVSSIAYSTDDMVEPWAVAVNTEEVIHVTSKKTKCVTRFSKNGEIKEPIKDVNFMTPSGIAIDKNDRLIVSDLTSNLLTAHEADGTFISTIGSSMSPIQHLDRPRYVTVAPNNDIIVCDSGNHALKVFDSDGNFVQKIGELGKGEGQLKCPYGVCTDIFGNMIVADHYNDRVSFFSKTGQFIRHLVTSSDGVMHPQGVCLTSNLRLLVTHGGLKAHEVLVYDLRNNKTDNTSPDTLVFV